MIRTDRAPSDATRDRILGGRIVIWQPVSGYRVAIDPILLAATIPARPGLRVLDLGCGVGAISLCLLSRVPELHVTGLERDPLLTDLAAYNAIENGVADRFSIVLGDVETPPPALCNGQFDLVVVNPPYQVFSATCLSPSQGKRSANVEDQAGLGPWIRTSEAALKPKGRLALIHRADRLADILISLRDRFGEVAIHPLWPKQGMAARRLVLHARKAVATPLQITAGTVLHEPDGQFTEEAGSILAGSALSVGRGPAQGIHDVCDGNPV